MSPTDDLDALAEMGLPGASPSNQSSRASLWHRVAFGGGVCVTMAAITWTVIVIIPAIASALASVLQALPALVSG